MMDAKAQRMVRSLRIKTDENIAPIDGPQKTIHQRNKSSPALATLANGKSVSARTAFGDVSNTANLNRPGPTKDDLAYPAKPKSYQPEKVALSQVPLTKNSATFLRPAQRPLSVSSLRGLLSGSSTLKESDSISRPTTTGTQQDVATATANTRKVLTKRNTTIFKDTSLSTVCEVAPAPPKPTTTLPALLHQTLTAPKVADVQTKEQDATTNESPSIALTAPLQHLVQASESERSNENITKPAVAVATNSEEAEELQTFHDSLSVQLPQIENHALPPLPISEANGILPNAVADSISVMPKNRPTSVHIRSSKSQLRETEGYWDDEDNVEDDGYVSAHSLRSRGENTTGGVTTVLFPQVTKQVKRELAAARQLVESSRTVEEIEDECFDTSMVAEYGDEIFAYMKELEIKMLPNAHYMDNQAEIQWSMRSVLMDWVVQVHIRFNLLPETLFLTINYIDRFLSCKIVSLGKLQLVGATAIFIAAKYEEINCPSVQEIVFMVDGGYTVDEVLKAERFMLSMLQFELGFPGPMSFLRRISKADDYDLETRTLAKYFLEVTIMDERFVGSPASFLAAGSHCLARLMLRKGSWAPSHVYYSGYTYSQLLPLLMLMVECCECPRKHHLSVYNKYCDKRFKRASTFVETEMMHGFRLPAATKELSSPQIIEYFEQVPWNRDH